MDLRGTLLDNVGERLNVGILPATCCSAQFHTWGSYLALVILCNILGGYVITFFVSCVVLLVLVCFKFVFGFSLLFIFLVNFRRFYIAWASAEMACVSLSIHTCVHMCVHVCVYARKSVCVCVCMCMCLFSAYAAKHSQRKGK